MKTTNDPPLPNPAPASPGLGVRLAVGSAMGIADAVPGVSGGTIALICGVYHQLIRHLHACITLVRCPWGGERWRAGRAALAFLLPLGLAAVIALFLTTRLLVGHSPDLAGLSMAEALPVIREHAGILLQPHTAPLVLAFFFGLVLASLAIPWRARRQHRRVHWLSAGVAALAAGLIAVVPPAAGSVHPLALFAAGAVAISVMLLPGISGSLMLLVLGMYHPVAASLHEGHWLRLSWVVAGMAAGVALIIPLLRRLLQHAHDGTMATLSGFMLGSLVALWPWRSHYVPKQIGEWGPMQPLLPQGAWWWEMVAVIAGVGVLLAAQYLAARSQGKDPPCHH